MEQGQDSAPNGWGEYPDQYCRVNEDEPHEWRLAEKRGREYWQNAGPVHSGPPTYRFYCVYCLMVLDAQRDDLPRTTLARIGLLMGVPHA